MLNQELSRRDAVKFMAAAASGLSLSGISKASEVSAAKTRLGLDAHSVRSMKWKAPQLIEFAASQGLDAVLLNGFQYFESMDEAYLKGVRNQAKDLGVEVRIGAGGISEGAKTFKDQYGSAKDVLSLGIRVAEIFNTSVLNCRIGNIDDRYGDGGIEARLDEVAETMNAVRSRALDTGVKFAFENHGGDTRSEEILALIERVGSDLCGVMLDPGNALWALEDPMVHLEKLGEHVLCMSVRDYMLWPTAEGAMFQWTAIGEGLMDVERYVSLLQAKCPKAPLFVESISNSPRPIPFLKDEFWEGFPNVAASDMKDFLALLRKGHALEVVKPAAGETQKAFDQRHQKSEFEKSLRKLRSIIA